MTVENLKVRNSFPQLPGNHQLKLCWISKANLADLQFPGW